jgi:4-oxalocrotonate tautomerase
MSSASGISETVTTNGGLIMPVVNIKLVKGVYDSQQKQTLLTKVTDAIESVYPGLRDLTFVTIDEIQEGVWSIGGEPVTAGKVTDHAHKHEAA